jgi:hypothetical protein
MFNLKQLTLYLQVTCGKDLQACLSMQNIQVAMINCTKRLRVVNEKNTLWEKMFGFLIKNAKIKEFLV